MVAKMLANAQPPGYRRTAPVARPKLDPFLGWIREILKTRPTSAPMPCSAALNACCGRFHLSG